MHKFLAILALTVLTLSGTARATSYQLESAESPATPTFDAAQQWLVDWMVEREPLDARIYYEDALETPEERLARYQSIAEDALITATMSKPLFRGDWGLVRTAAFLIATAYHESRFLRHVDYGIGKYARNGESWCLLQVWVPEGKRTIPWNVVEDRLPRQNDPSHEIQEGFTGPDLVSDRRACFQAGLRVMRSSLGTCRHLPLEERLSAFTSGSCDRGRKESRTRVRTALNMLGSTWDVWSKLNVSELPPEVTLLLSKENPMPVLVPKG